jgi:signal transduction histidine kinase
MYSLDCLADLTALYETAGNLAPEHAAQELWQHILTHLRRVVRSDDACLLLYHAAQQCFLPVAVQGTFPGGTLAAVLGERPIQQFMNGGPGESLTHLTLNDRCLTLVTLSLNSGLLGIVALVVPDGPALCNERQLLLATLGRVAAHLLRNYERQQQIRQEVAEAERKRLACELHDSLAQQLAHVLHKLEYMQRLLEKQQPEMILTQVRRAQGILRESLRRLRYHIEALLPEHEDERTLLEKIHALLRDCRKNHPALDIRCKMTGIDETLSLSTTLEKPLLGFVQEALTNVWKHAHATQAQLHMRLFPNMLLLEVIDNGIGFRPEQALSSPTAGTFVDDTPHFGLRLMRERILELGGSWELRSSPGQGTTVRAHIPLPASSHPSGL